MSYYTKITKAGLAAITTAMNNNSKVPITYMAFGDGNGYIPEPDENAISLVNEVYRVGVNKVEVHNKNQNWLVCEAIIPSAVGGFNIREVALYDSTGNTMLAIASYPPTYKPTVEEGAAKIQTIRIVIQVDNSGNFELIVDPDVVLATAAFVDEQISKASSGLLTITDLKQYKPKKTGEIINVISFNDPIIGLSEFYGGGFFRYSASIVTGNDVDTFLSEYGGGWKRIKRKNEYDITWGGAIGLGEDETLKCQNVLKVAGPNSKIIVPNGKFYVPGGLQLFTAQNIHGNGYLASVLIGNGTKPIIKTSDNLSSSNVRHIGLFDLGIDNFSKSDENASANAVKLWLSPDSKIQRCALQARNVEALDQRLSVRCAINQNRITSSKSEFAYCLLNNCNGTDASNNTVSGGSAGGGVRVGMTQTLNLSNLVVEVAGTVAVRIAGDDGADGGRCSGINLSGLYAEQCRRVVEVGLKYECYGINLDGFKINQHSTSVVSTYEEPFHFGRVNGLNSRGGFAEGGNTHALIKLYGDSGAISGVTPYLSDSIFKTKAVYGYVAPYFSFNGTTENFRMRIFGRNEISINSDDCIGDIKEWISPTIKCNTAVPNTIAIPPSPFGGRLISAEIIDASELLDGTLRLGQPASQSEIISLDLSTLTFSYGMKKIISDTENKYIRDTGTIFGLIPGVKESTFRIKLRYRN